MHVRSLSASVDAWPTRASVLEEARAWASTLGTGDATVLRIGCFGSYARGDDGYGSDLDLVVVVSESNTPFQERSLRWGSPGLQVPCDFVVYTAAEWTDPVSPASGFLRTAKKEVIWLWERDL